MFVNLTSMLLQRHLPLGAPLPSAPTTPMPPLPAFPAPQETFEPFCRVSYTQAQRASLARVSCVQEYSAVHACVQLTRGNACRM